METINTIKLTEDIKNTIIITNNIIIRWINTNKIEPYKITDDEIKSILFGNIRKVLIQYGTNYRFFKKFKRTLVIKTGSNRLLEAIANTEINRYDPHILTVFKDIVDNLDFKELQNINNIFNSTEINSINYKNIEEITF